MFRRLLQAYSRLLIFAVGLLLGIQVPSFIDQYEKRIDAHYQEASISVSGFQRTARLMFDGDIEALIDYYENSQDAVFENDAASIRLIVDRYNRLAGEQAALAQSLLSVALHVAFSGDPEFVEETFAQYSYTVPLNSLAVLWGLALAVLLVLTIDGCLFGCVHGGKYIVSKASKRKHGKARLQASSSPENQAKLRVEPKVG